MRTGLRGSIAFTMMVFALWVPGPSRAQSPGEPAGGQVLDPGLDPAFETRRRQRPLGWGGAGLAFGLMGCALAVGLRGHREGSGRAGTVGLVLAGIGAGWGIGEVGLHLSVDSWAAHVKVRSNCYHDNPRGYFKRSHFYDDPTSEAWCVDDLSAVWRECERPTDKGGERRRGILALGDSFTDGVGVFRQDTWPSRLQERLGHNATTPVVNCGRSDSYVAHIAKRYLAYEDRHRPSVVVYAMVLNDVPPPEYEGDTPDISFQIETRDQYGERVSKHPIWGPVTAHSAVARLGLEQWARWRIASETRGRYVATYADPNGPKFTESMDLVADMNQVARERDSHLLVVLWPLLHRLSDYPFTQAHTHIAQALGEREVAFLDLLPIFEGEDASTLQVHPTDHHPNEVAHDRVAEAIAAELKRRGWGDEPQSPKGSGPPSP